MQYLKQSTAITLKIGPFIDDTDGKTAETGLTIAQADVRLSKNGANIAQKNEATSCTHDELGIYGCPIDATDTATLGRLQLFVHESGALPVWHEFMVVTANVYDSLCSTDILQADLTQCGGSTVAAGAIPNAAADAAGGLPVSDAGGLDLDTKLANTNEITAARMGALTDWIDGGRLDLIIDLILADTAELQTDWVNGGRLDILLDAIPTTAMRGTDNAALASGVDLTKIHGVALTETVNGYLAAAFVKLFDVATPLLISSEVMRGTDNAALADTTLTTADASALATSIESNIRGADNDDLKDISNQIDTIPTSAGIADAVWDELVTDVAHATPYSTGCRLRNVDIASSITHGTAQSGTSTSITLAAGESANDGVYNRNLLSITHGTGAGQTRQIADYNGTTKIVTVDRNWRVSPDATSVYQITPDNVFALVDQGTAQAGTSTTITLRAYAASVNDTYLCNQVAIIAGTGRGQSRLIGAYNGTTKVVTICGDNWVTTPDATSVYVLLPYGTTCTSCIGTYARGQINTECDTALTDYDPPTRTEATADKDAIIADLLTMKKTAAGSYDRATDSLEAIRDRGDAAWSAAAGTPSVLIDTTIAAVTDQTHFTLTAGSDIDDAYKDQAIVLYDASNSDYPSIRKVSAYTGATKTVTLDSAPDFTIVPGDGSKVFVTAPGTTAPTAGQVADQVWDEDKADHTDPTTFGGQNSFVNG